MNTYTAKTKYLSTALNELEEMLYKEGKNLENKLRKYNLNFENKLDYNKIIKGIGKDEKYKLNKKIILEFLPEFYNLYDDLLKVDSTKKRKMQEPKIKFEWRPILRNIRFRYLDKSNFVFTLLCSSLCGMAGSNTGLLIAALLNIPFTKPIFIGLLSGLMFGTALSLEQDTGSYDPKSNKIIFTENNFCSALYTLVAELYHWYQHKFNSPTKDDPLLYEGSERACTIKVMEKFANQHKDSSLAEKIDVLNSAQKIEILRDFQCFIHSFKETGDVESEQLDAFLYNIGASAIFSAERRAGEKIYSKVFHGEWSDLPEWFSFFNKYAKETGW